MTFFFSDQSTLTAYESSNEGQYLEFQPQGYLAIGQPAPGGTDCRRTRPNGLPFCLSYDFDGNRLTVTSPGGSVDSDRATFDAINGVLSLADMQLERVNPITVSDLC